MTIKSSQESPDQFKFVLALNGAKIMERIFDADQYNHSVRYSVNIKDIQSEIISSFKRILGSPDHKLSFDYLDTNLIKYYMDNSDVLSKEDDILERKSKGEMVNGFYENKEEEFSFILYINNNYILERKFFVKNFNPKSRFSLELIEYFDNVVESVKNRIKQADITNMFEENEIKEFFNYTYEKIRSLSKDERKQHLWKIEKHRESIQAMLVV